jgi:hypothetical protein
MPITLVAIHGNVVLARVGLQENDCGILLYGSGARADEVEVVKKPREGSVIIACTSLECFVWLPTIRDQYVTHRVEKVGDTHRDFVRKPCSPARFVSHKPRYSLSPLTRIPIPWPEYHQRRLGRRTRLAPQRAPGPHQSQSARACVVSRAEARRPRSSAALC